MQKRTKMVAILKENCPQCRKGNVFKFGPLNLRDFDKTYSNCPECGFKFEKEPGFFWAAMYFSYAFGVGIIFATGLFIYLFFGNVSYWYYIIPVSFLLVFSAPFLFRYSRIALLYTFGEAHYKPEL